MEEFSNWNRNISEAQLFDTRDNKWDKQLSGSHSSVQLRGSLPPFCPPVAATTAFQTTFRILIAARLWG